MQSAPANHGLPSVEDILEALREGREENLTDAQVLIAHTNETKELIDMVHSLQAQVDSTAENNRDLAKQVAKLQAEVATLTRQVTSLTPQPPTSIDEKDKRIHELRQSERKHCSVANQFGRLKAAFRSYTGRQQSPSVAPEMPRASEQTSEQASNSPAPASQPSVSPYTAAQLTPLLIAATNRLAEVTRAGEALLETLDDIHSGQSLDEAERLRNLLQDPGTRQLIGF
jgi:cell division septum initiation protein DivIVA